jgi:hypothetical protein
MARDSFFSTGIGLLILVTGLVSSTTPALAGAKIVVDDDRVQCPQAEFTTIQSAIDLLGCSSIDQCGTAADLGDAGALLDGKAREQSAAASASCGRSSRTPIGSTTPRGQRACVPSWSRCAIRSSRGWVWVDGTGRRLCTANGRG